MFIKPDNALHRHFQTPKALEANEMFMKQGSPNSSPGVVILRNSLIGWLFASFGFINQKHMENVGVEM
jgi:hypothetical protein